MQWGFSLARGAMAPLGPNEAPPMHLLFLSYSGVQELSSLFLSHEPPAAPAGATSPPPQSAHHLSYPTQQRLLPAPSTSYAPPLARHGSAAASAHARAAPRPAWRGWWAWTAPRPAWGSSPMELRTKSKEPAPDLLPSSVSRNRTYNGRRSVSMSWEHELVPSSRETTA